MKKLSNKIAYILIGVAIAISGGIALASNLGVLNSTQKGDLVVGIGNGNYRLLAPGSDGMIPIASSTSVTGIVWGTASTTGGSGLSSLNGLISSTQTFASGTPATGLDFFINSSGSVHTFRAGLQSGYNIPFTASTTQWSDFYNTPSNRITAGSGLSWSGNTLSNVVASSTIIAGGTATHSPSITFGTSTDTNILLSIVCATSTCTFNPAWTGTLASGRLNSNVVQAITNDTNVTGSITAQNLTLGWTGVLSIARGGTATSTTPTASAVLLGNGTDWDYSVIPSCSNSTNSKLLYNNTTRTFTCGTDQSGGGGSLSGGTDGFVTRWIGTSTVSSGVLIDNGTVAGVNATSSTVNFLVRGAGLNGIFGVSSSTGISLFNIGNNGRVGIGTSTPSAMLAVQGTSTLPTVQLFQVASSSGAKYFTVASNGSSTFSSLGTGNVKSSSGTLYNAAIVLSTSDVSGTLAVANGGTGATSLANGRVLRGAGTSAVTTGLLADNGTVAGVSATSSAVTFNVQGTGVLDPFNVSSSTGTSYLRVTRDGIVSIGTSTPTTTLSGLLQISHPTFARIVMTASSSANQVVGFFDTRGDAVSTSRFQFGTRSNHPLLLFTGDSSKLGITASGGLSFGSTYSFTNDPGANNAIFQGKIGIGTTSPVQTLVVAGDWRATGALYDSANSAGTAGMVLQTTGTGTQWVATSSLGITGGVGGGSPGGSYGQVQYNNAGSFDGSSALITNGTVSGVNATSSSINFLVQGTGSNNAFQVNSSTGTTMLKLDALGQLTLGSSANTGHKFYNNGDMRIDSSIYLNGDSPSCYGNGILNSISFCGSYNGGDVVIRNSFASNFSINGSGLWLSGHGALSGNGISLKDYGYVGINTSTAANAFTIQATSSANTLPLFVVASNTGASLLQVNANGNVGINSSTPSYKFTVDGTVGFLNITSASAGNTLCVNGSGSGRVENSLSASSCSASSVYLKNLTGEITPEVARYIVERMKGVTFAYKWEENEHYGFIAEEAAKIDREVEEKFGVKARLAQYAKEDTIDAQTGHEFKKGDPTAVDYEMYTAVLTVYLQSLEKAPASSNNLLWCAIALLAVMSGYAVFKNNN